MIWYNGNRFLPGCDRNRLCQKLDAACAILLDTEGEPLSGAASFREVAIKSPLGRADFRVDPAALAQGFAESGYNELPVQARNAAAVCGRLR